MLPNEYRLSLCNGNGWLISADDENLKWLKKFARIMKLQPSSSNNLPRIRFVKMNSGQDVNDVVPDRLQPQKVYDFGTIKITYDHRTQNVICELDNIRESIGYVNMCYSLICIYDRLLDVGGLPIHAGLVQIRGRGILLAGRGGVGKSTCCRRMPKPWESLSDDEALIVPDGHGTYRAHPMPTWSDYFTRGAKNTWDVQHSVPIIGIFFIVQSKVDRVEPIGKGKSAMLIAESASQVYMKFPMKLDKSSEINFRRKIFENACDLSRNIQSYYLYVSLTGKFWEHIEDALGIKGS